MAISKQMASELKAQARSLFFSTETIERTLSEASAGQIRAITEMMAFEQEVRGRRKRERLFRKSSTRALYGFSFPSFTYLNRLLTTCTAKTPTKKVYIKYAISSLL